MRNPSVMSSYSNVPNSILIKGKERQGVRREIQNNPSDFTQQKKEVNLKFIKNLAPPLMAAAVVFLSPICNNSPVPIAQAIDVQKGAALFSRACIGCHVAGGNIIQPGATLFTEDLQRNGADSEEDTYQITYSGKGRMPGFGEKCTPRGQCTFGPRLQDEEIKLLAEFVKSLLGLFSIDNQFEQQTILSQESITPSYQTNQKQLRKEHKDF